MIEMPKVQLPLNLEDNEEPLVETKETLEKLETPELRRRYQESTGRNSNYRFILATEEVLRAILIEGIQNSDTALHRLKAIEDGHPTADKAIEWAW